MDQRKFRKKWENFDFLIFLVPFLSKPDNSKHNRDSYDVRTINHLVKEEINRVFTENEITAQIRKLKQDHTGMRNK